MKSFTAEIIDPVGLHARPATIAVSVASKFKSEITIGFDGQEVNMKSILNIISLGATPGSEITVTAKGEDEEEAIATIQETLRTQKVIG